MPKLEEEEEQVAIQEPKEHSSFASTEEPQPEAEATVSQEKYARYLNYLSLGLIGCCTLYGGATIWGWLDDNTTYTVAEAIFTAVLVGLGYFVSIVAIFKRRAVLKDMAQRKSKATIKR